MIQSSAGVFRALRFWSPFSTKQLILAAPFRDALPRRGQIAAVLLGERMRIILLISAILTGSGLVMAHVAGRGDGAASGPQAAAASTKIQPAAGGASSSSYQRTAKIAGDARGHFHAEASIGGRRAAFLVDTGASIVALSEPDADRLGVRAGPNDPKVVLQTANGKVTGARVRLASIDIGGVRVQDVDAVILPGHALKQNLLGMSFLSRISRYEFRSGQLVLEQ